MANKTIGQLTLETVAAGGDWLEIEKVAGGLSRRISKTNLIGALLTGGGTINTGGNSLTIAGASTINGSLVGNISGGGTLALGGFTATVPATGTLVTTAASQTLTNKKIDSIFLNYYNLTNNTFGAINVWTPITSGWFLLHNLTYATICSFLVRGGGNSVIEGSWDNTSAYSATPNTASSINMYYDATYGYVIQNKMGADCYIGVHAIGS